MYTEISSGTARNERRRGITGGGFPLAVQGLQVAQAIDRVSRVGCRAAEQLLHYAK
jgi:hypothetical protein